VGRVSLGSHTVVVEGDETTIRIDTADFTPDQQASLARSIARRVREAGTGSVLTVPD
jgi:hypothetical protein